MPKRPKPRQLLVEGKNDRHVIWALCNQYQLPETFSNSPSQSFNPHLASLATDTRDANGTSYYSAGT
jgi:hypothetical protein